MKPDLPQLPVRGLLCYCRQGYASQMALELEACMAEQNISGYIKFTKQAGYVAFYFHQTQSLTRLQKQVKFMDLMFARQLVFLVAKPITLDESDRVASLSANLPACDMPLQTCVVESEDTENGKNLSRFCRKFAVPLRNALRERDYLYKRKFNKPIAGLCWHILLPSSEQALVGISIPGNRSDHEQGIHRLKMPQDAPSRSTLKLEEAIHTFIPKAEQPELFREGYRAVDLGACPGGWTYQLVKRGVQVEAIDNGKMQSQLMATGLVEYYPVDGFKHRPVHGSVQWLVCDMIEQPQRVAKLMAEWLVRGDTRHALFNLKLPMQSRFATMKECLHEIIADLNANEIAHTTQAKHLYHNRDEVTVCVLRQE